MGRAVEYQVSVLNTLYDLPLKTNYSGPRHREREAVLYGDVEDDGENRPSDLDFLIGDHQDVGMEKEAEEGSAEEEDSKFDDPDIKNIPH